MDKALVATFGSRRTDGLVEKDQALAELDVGHAMPDMDLVDLAAPQDDLATAVAISLLPVGAGCHDQGTDLNVALAASLLPLETTSTDIGVGDTIMTDLKGIHASPADYDTRTAAHPFVGTQDSEQVHVSKRSTGTGFFMPTGEVLQASNTQVDAVSTNDASQAKFNEDQVAIEDWVSNDSISSSSKGKHGLNDQ